MNRNEPGGFSKTSDAGFSLLELLAVIAIIAIILSMAAPSIGNFRSTAGRSGAVRTLMNLMEQARVSALESGRSVYVVFHRRIFPERDEIIVLREPDPASGSTQYEPLTGWIRLPERVLLHETSKSDILAQEMPSGASGSTTPGFDPAKSPVPLSPTESGERFNILAFNPYGGISYPAASANSKLMLIVSEGVRGNGGTEAVISAQKERAGGFEIITFRRFTGRATLEVSSL